MGQLKDFENILAASVFLMPFTEKELTERFKNYSSYGVFKCIQPLEKEAIYYKGDIMHINKKWAKENLKGFELDFRSNKEKEMDGMTDFAKALKKQRLI